MTLANDSVDVTPGSGATIASHLVSSKEHQAHIQADHNGILCGTAETYTYVTPPITVGANQMNFDLFNGSGSGKTIYVWGLFAHAKADVAITGSLGTRFDLYRTSAVGTGGTAASSDSATVDVSGGNITKFDENNSAVPAQITARAIPTGGATKAHWLPPVFIFLEETNGSCFFYGEKFNILRGIPFVQHLTLREGEGLLVQQGSVGTSGALIWRVVFTLV